MEDENKYRNIKINLSFLAVNSSENEMKRNWNNRAYHFGLLIKYEFVL